LSLLAKRYLISLAQMAQAQKAELLVALASNFSFPPVGSCTGLDDAPSSNDSAPVMDSLDASASSSVGRPRQRVAKYPSAPKYPRSGAPKRRHAEKPHRTRAEAQRPRAVLQTGTAISAEAANLKAHLLAPASMTALLLEVESGEMGYVP
jgi:hypothetical protein